MTEQALVKLQACFYGVVLTICTAWVLYIGQAIIVPIVVAVLVAYILFATARSFAGLPVIGRAPVWLHYVLVWLIFIVLVLSLVAVFASSLDQFSNDLPKYQANLARLSRELSAVLGIDQVPSWDKIRAMTLDKLNLQNIALSMVSSLANAGGQVILVLIYVSFIAAERLMIDKKIAQATKTRTSAEQIKELLREISEKIGQYLAVKTLINVILAFSSYIIMKLIGIDFALLWAVLIGLLNYIPYVGSLIGVAFPVILAIAQFGSLAMLFLTLTSLTAVQMYVGNVLEPRMIGKSLNLSPFIVLVALAIWGSLWGIMGAILAIPMTAVIVIICAEFSSTRPIAVMLSSDGQV